jgi:hypothetical protein
MRRRGPGLPELAGILSMMGRCPPPAVRLYAREVIKLRPLYRECLICRGKWTALVYLLLSQVDRRSAMPWFIKTIRIQDAIAMRHHVGRDLVAEVLAAATPGASS